jgi:hypothetical protein
MDNHYLYYGPLQTDCIRTLVNNNEGSIHTTLTSMTRFTDAENTGAPIVPQIRDTEQVAADDGRVDREFLEEMVWSHRQ